MKIHPALILSLGLTLSAAPAFASEKPVERELEKASWLASRINPLNPAELPAISAAIWHLYAQASGERVVSSPAIRPWLVEADRATGGEPGESSGAMVLSVLGDTSPADEAPPSFTMFIVSLGLVGMSVASTLKQRVG